MNINQHLNRKGTTSLRLTNPLETDKAVEFPKSTHCSGPPRSLQGATSRPTWWKWQKHFYTWILWAEAWVIQQKFSQFWDFQSENHCSAWWKNHPNAFTEKIGMFWQLLTDHLCRHIFPVLVWASTVESPAQWCFCNIATTVIRSFRAKRQGHGQLKIKLAEKKQIQCWFLDIWKMGWTVSHKPQSDLHQPTSMEVWSDETCNLNSTWVIWDNMVFHPSSKLMPSRLVWTCHPGNPYPVYSLFAKLVENLERCRNFWPTTRQPSHKTHLTMHAFNQANQESNKSMTNKQRIATLHNATNNWQQANLPTPQSTTAN